MVFGDIKAVHLHENRFPANEPLIFRQIAEFLSGSYLFIGRKQGNSVVESPDGSFFPRRLFGAKN